MDRIESIVAKHYSVGDLEQRILEGLAATVDNMNALTIDDLATVDEFHIGGRKATEHALSRLSIRADHHVLDVGCGIGGAARTAAALTGCTVTGIDLTPEYVDVARTLTRLTGLAGRVSFVTGSALDMPASDDAFDTAITFHAAMNIRNRDVLYREIARVLKPGAQLCIYDVMKRGPDPVVFPVPWAMSEESSHLVTPAELGDLLENAGFELKEVEDRTEIAIGYFNQRMAAVSNEPAALGAHLVMGPTAKEKITNIRFNVESGRVAPVLVIARKKV